MPNNSNLSTIHQEIRNSLIRNSTQNPSKIVKSIANTDYSLDQKFLYTPAPEIRKIAKNFYKLPLDELEELIRSNINEEKMLCAIILTYRYKKYPSEKKTIFSFYVKNIDHINYWNIIDLSADKILGHFIFENREYLTLIEKLSNSENIWHRRIAIISTWLFIKNDEFSLTTNLCKKFLNDQHHLIYKACGWMLREIGKRNEVELIKFLNENYKNMPSIMKSYAMERLSDEVKNSVKNAEI